MFSSPLRDNLESTINHMVHHRGQLTVYMRLNNIAVPSIYGPSADDRSF
ncbi:MAG: DinB family protein [Agriterribacter sp.]